VEYERSLVRKAWETGLFAIRSAGSGSGTSAYPKPDLLVFRPGGLIDVIQLKTAHSDRLRLTPEAWRDEVDTARRLRELGFKARAWVEIAFLRRGRRPRILRVRVDEHEEEALIVDYDPEADEISFRWERLEPY